MKQYVTRYQTARQNLIVAALAALASLSTDKDFCRALAKRFDKNFTAGAVALALKHQNPERVSLDVRPQWDGKAHVARVEMMIYQRRGHWRHVDIPLDAVATKTALKKWRDEVVKEEATNDARRAAAIMRGIEMQRQQLARFSKEVIAAAKAL